MTNEGEKRKRVFSYVYANKYLNVYLIQEKCLSLSCNPKITTMQIVSSREFRANQKKYFVLAEHEDVYVMRRNARPILVRVADDGDQLTAAELESIRKGVEDVKNGRTYKIQAGESLSEFLERIEPCMK